MKIIRKTLLSTVVLLTVTGAAQAALLDRGGGLIYDTDLNVTWLADANLAATNTFGLATNVNLGDDSYGNASAIYSTGEMNRGGATKWIDAMNASNYLGYNNWRLPTTLQPDATCGTSSGGISYNCTGSEMGHLFYSELGGVAGQNLTTTHNEYYNLFQNLPHLYWSGTEYVTPGSSLAFSMGDGGQGVHWNYNQYLYAMAVHAGDVAAVPVPAAAWLLGSGLLGFMGVARRKAA